MSQGPNYRRRPSERNKLRMQSQRNPYSVLPKAIAVVADADGPSYLVKKVPYFNPAFTPA